MSKKIFIVTGELSGDRLAAWYVQKRFASAEERAGLLAIGGDYLRDVGVALFDRFEKYNVVGIVEIIKHLSHLLKSIRSLGRYILDNNFEEVVLVDFPGFNMRLARMLKKEKPSITITYLSPPQVWCWGAWRVKDLKKHCDQLIVLYPFEVAWYQQRGACALWLGNPVYDAMSNYFSYVTNKKNMIALMPGSRKQEIEQLLPLLLQTVQILKQDIDSPRFIMPLARSISYDFLLSVACTHDLESVLGEVDIVCDDEEKYQLLAQCSAAISKPGTVTLELALLRVPTVIFYTTSWITYFLARIVVKVSWMGLPNLIVGREMFPELIQYNVTPNNIAQHVRTLLASASDKQMQRNFADCAAQLAVSEKIFIV